MKHPSVASPNRDEDFVSDCSLSFLDEIACNDTTVLTRELLFLKGAMKEKDKELTRLREEKNESIASKFSLMEEMGRLKEKVEIQDTEKAEATSKVAQAELSLHEALQKISNLEKKMEGSKLFEEMTEKLEFTQQEIEKAMAEMKGPMKTQGEEMTRVREEKDAALESKLCIMTQSQQEKEEAQQEKEDTIKKFLQAIEEKEAEAYSKLAHTELSLREALNNISNKMSENVVQLTQQNTEIELSLREALNKISHLEKEMKDKEMSHQEALQKISNLEKEVKDNKNIVTLPLSVWKSSGTKFVSHSGSSVLYDVLNCAPLKSGTFEWKIQVHSADSHNLLLGVIGSSLKLPLDHWIGHTKKTWGYVSSWGSAYYWNGGQKVISNLPKYTAGSVVHFMLDLTNEGTLCVSVDGSPSVQAFSNMKSLIDNDEGFLPATSMYFTNNIELLEFKCL